MIQRKSRGSLVYEILIVILLILLMGTILYPKSVWERIDRQTFICRENMRNVVTSEILFIQTAGRQNYDSSLVNVFEFVKNSSVWGTDTTLAALRDSFYVTTIQGYLENYHELADSVARDSAYALINGSDSLMLFETVEKMFSDFLTCPTINRTYEIGVVDTSAIKLLKVWCPVNETDIDSINSEFMFRVLGGGRVENHGNIDNGEPSWKEAKRK